MYAARFAWRARAALRPRGSRASSFSASTAEETVDWPIIAGGALGGRDEGGEELAGHLVQRGREVAPRLALRPLEVAARLARDTLCAQLAAEDGAPRVGVHLEDSDAGGHQKKSAPNVETTPDPDVDEDEADDPLIPIS